MAAIADLRQSIRRQLEAAADENTRAKLVRLIPGAFALGVPVPALRGLAAIFASEHADLDLDSLCKLMDALCERGCREEILFGTFVLGRRNKLLPSIAWDNIESWTESLDNWETCDQLASNVVGFTVAANLDHVNCLVEWTKSKNLWRRRFALATASALNQKGRVFPAESFRVCLPLLNDPELMVRKAVGWVIREASKKDEPAAFAFVKKHQRLMHPTVLRESIEKMTTANRATFLK